MSRRKWLLAILAVVLAAVLAVVLPASYRRLEQPHRFYRTHSEAVAAGELARGWLPEWTPAEAVDIHIQGDLGTSERWLKFRVPDQPAEARLKSRLTAVPWETVNEIPFSRPALADWWFEGLIQQQPANDAALYADVFRTGETDQDTLFVAFERASLEGAAGPTTNNVFVWTSGAR